MKIKTLAVTSMVLALILALWVGVAGAASGGTTVASGFNGPMGVTVAPDGSVWVIDSGVGGDTEMPGKDPETGQDTTLKIGDSARIVQITPDGKQVVAAMLPSILMGQEALGGGRLTWLNGVLYATSGGWEEAAGPERMPNEAAVVKLENGKVVEVANTWDLESSQNPDGTLIDTHPYGLTAGPDGQLWVADAGGNDLLTVDPATGQVKVVAVFSGLPSPMANPNRGGAKETDPVPTQVAFDKAGNMYVSFLSGAPFVPGSAKVGKVSPDGQVSDYATGLTTLTDLRTGPDGNMYAVQFGLFTEQGPTPNTGRIIRIKAGDASEVVASGLSFPTSIDFNDNGDAYVTINGVGAPGSGEVVKFPALTSQPGSPLAETTPAPAALPTTGGNYPSAYWVVGTLLVSGLALVIAGYFLKNRGTAVRELN